MSGGIVVELELEDYGVAFAETTPFIVTDTHLLGNLHEIDLSLANSYASHVLRGGPLHIHYASVVSSRHLVSGSSFPLTWLEGSLGSDRCTWCS